MRLYLVQHGEAVDKLFDTQRPLSQQGIKDIEQLTAFLARRALTVERIFHSGKLRAQQSAKILANAITPSNNLDQLHGIDPNESPAPFVEIISGWQEDAMVVGHLPFLARATNLLLTGEEEAAHINFQPGSLVCLERDTKGDYGLAFMIRPHLLP